MSSRLEILKNSLVKKEALFDGKLQSHIDCVKEANGQPLNDKRNGRATLDKWESQNNSLRNLKESIEKTKAAIEREEEKIAFVEMVDLPAEIKRLIEAGQLVQWRKHPSFFFVAGVDKARIHLLDSGVVAHRYVSQIPTKEQYARFREVFNGLNRALSSPQPSVQVLPTNEQNAVDPGAVMETLQREEFIERDVL